MNLATGTRERSSDWGSLAFYRPDEAPENEQRLVGVEDIGPGPLLLLDSEPPPIGSALRLLLHSRSGPEGGTTIRARAVVRWHRGAPLPPAMAVEILSSEPPPDQDLADWLALWPKAAACR